MAPGPTETLPGIVARSTRPSDAPSRRCARHAGGHGRGSPTRTTVGTSPSAPRRNRPPRFGRRDWSETCATSARAEVVACAMYFATVAWLTSIPSFTSSPWMRGAPHSGLCSDIVRIRARASGGDGRSPVASATLPCPEQAEALAMPGDDGLWLHDHDGRSPIARKAAKTWVQIGSKTAQTPGKTRIWQIPESKTSQPHSLSCLICKTSIPGSNPGGASNLRSRSGEGCPP